VVAKVSLTHAEVDRVNRSAQRIIGIVSGSPRALGPVNLVLQAGDKIVIRVSGDVHPVNPLRADAEMRASTSTKDSNA
jgi:hypothetical protein